MTVALHRQFCAPTRESASLLDDPAVADVLRALDGRSDATSRAAARIIRAKEIQILSLEAEIVDAEWRAIAHAVEIDRIRDASTAFWERRNAKGAKR